MSYDLYFYKKANNQTTETDIRNWLSDLPGAEPSEEDTWDYLNQDTGAYCRFSYASGSDIRADDGVEEEPPEFLGVEDTGFSFSINFLRPDFFGYECFPLVEKLCHTFDLVICDPQGDGLPRPYGNELMENWLEANEGVAKRSFEEFGLNYMDKDKADEVWHYNIKKKHLQKELGEGIYVPRIMFVNRHDTTSIETLTVWPLHIPYLLPKVDLVLIRREKKRLFWTKREEGFVRYDDLVKALDLHFIPREEHLFLPPGRVNAELISKFRQLPIFSSLKKYGEAISPDHFVNVRPEEK